MESTATTILPETEPGSVGETPAGQPATILIPYSDTCADPADNQRKTPPDPALEAEMLADMKARVLAGLHPQKQPIEIELRGKRLARVVSGFTRHRVLGRLEEWASEQPTNAGIDAWGGTVWATVVSPGDDYARTLINLRENLIRSELPAADLAEAASNLRKSTGKEIAEIARDIGRPLSGVANIVRAYENTTADMWSAFRKGAISQKQIIALAALTGEEQQLSFDRLMGTAPTDTPKPRDTAKTTAPEPSVDEGGDDDDDGDDGDAQSDAASRRDARVGARLRLVGEMLDKTPGLKDSTHDFVMGMRSVLRFSGGRGTPAQFERQIEGILAQVAIRDARGSISGTTGSSPAPDPRQLSIPGAAPAQSTAATKPTNAPKATAAVKPAKAAAAKPAAAKPRKNATKPTNAAKAKGAAKGRK